MESMPFPILPILLVDDEEDALQSMDIILRLEGIDNIVCIQDSREVMPYFAKNDVGVIILDLTMPNISGEELLQKISTDYPDIPIIIVTGENQIEIAVRCIQGGAFDFFVKPIDDNRLITTVRKAIRFRELKMENSILKDRFLSNRLEHPEAFSNIITNTEKMRTIFKYVEAIAKTSKQVLITGETGVGKELIAGAIHRLSGRKGEFVTVNASTLTENMFADTLFGHTKGAYTGAINERKGLIERAAGGTFFLDEIGDMSLDSQVKLLRLVQEREYLPVGSDLPKRTDTRIIVATNRDLQAMIDKGKFRKDLYYRLRTHHIDLPPLRERIDDLPWLLDHFLEKASKELNKKKPTAPPELLTLLGCYNFPGNIRELEAMVFDAVSNHKAKKLSMASFKKMMGYNEKKNSALTENQVSAGLSISGKFPTLKEAEKYLITEALTRAKNNQTIAAGLLGITRQALNQRLNKKK